MPEPDFSGIDPLRVPEARRRVAALNLYLAMPNPTSADTQHLAETIGLNRTQFSRLARVWRDHRDARLLVIGKRGPATRDYGMDERSVTIAREIIADTGPSATLAKIAPEIERRCAEAGAAPPSRQTISNYIRAARADVSATAVGPPRIVVGRLWFHLPVRDKQTDAMPMLLAAVMLPERIVITHIVSVDPDRPPDVSHLVDMLASKRETGADARPLLLGPDDRRVASGALARAGLSGTRSHNRSVQSELSNAFAGRLGPLPVIHQRGMARPATKRVVTRQDEPLPAKDVIATINAAVDTNNAAASTMLAFDLRAI